MGTNPIMLMQALSAQVIRHKRVMADNCVMICSSACAGFGLFLGISASFLGIGGGPINIFVLSFFLGMETKTAALHSLYIIFFSQMASLVMSIARGKVPAFEFPVLIVMAVGAVVGADLGRKIATRMDNRATDKLFIGVMVLVFLICIMNLCR